MLTQNKRNLFAVWIGILVVAALAYETAINFLFPDSVYLIGLIGVFIAAIIFKTPILGLFVVVLLSPFKTQGDDILLLTRFLGLWVAAVLFISKILNGEPIRFSGMERPFLIMLAGMAISFFRTDDHSYVATHILSLTSLFGLMLVIMNVIRTEENLKRLIWVFFASSFIPLIFAYQQALDTTQEITYLRSYGTFPLPTGLGGFLLPIVVLAFSLIFYRGLFGAERLFVMGVFGAAVVGLVLTLSRGAILGCFMGLFVVFLFLQRQKISSRFYLFLVGIFITISIGLVWTSFQGRVVNPLFEFFSGDDAGVNVEQRYDEVSVIIPVTLDNYFMGTGLGNYDEAALRYRREFNLPDLPVYPHNIFMYFLGEVGIIGALGFFGLIAVLIILINRSMKNLISAPKDFSYHVYVAAVSSLIGYIFFVVTHNAFFTNEIWLTIALVLVCIRHLSMKREIGNGGLVVTERNARA